VSKGKEAAGALPAYNPADFMPGQAYARGSHTGAGTGHGQIVLVDEEDGSVIGELADGFQVVEDSKLEPGSKAELSVLRDQDQKTVEVTLGDRATFFPQGNRTFHQDGYGERNMPEQELILAQERHNAMQHERIEGLCRQLLDEVKALREEVQSLKKNSEGKQ